MLNKNILKGGKVMFQKTRKFFFSLLLVLGICFVSLLSACSKTGISSLEGNGKRPVVRITKSQGGAVGTGQYKYTEGSRTGKRFVAPNVTIVEPALAPNKDNTEE